MYANKRLNCYEKPGLETRSQTSIIKAYTANVNTDGIKKYLGHFTVSREQNELALINMTQQTSQSMT